MPNAQYSTFDRGFDQGHTEVPTIKSRKIEREYSSKKPSGRPVKKLLAFAVVVVMVASALAFVLPAINKSPETPQAPQDDQQAEITIPPYTGIQRVNYTISNFFENYPKPNTPAEQSLLGRQQGSVAFPQWYGTRHVTYNDTVVSTSYPLTMLYDYYSARIPASIKSPRMGYGVYSFYRTTIDATNLRSIATGTGKDPFFMPVLGNVNSDGGSVTWNWYQTYLTAEDCLRIDAGTSYANTFYGVPPGSYFQGANANDGWWAEIQGMMTFDRAAATKFLNLGNTGDLTADWALANPTGNEVGAAWAAQWTVDGTASASSFFDTFTAYDYQINSGTVDCWLTMDPSSTPTNLVLRMWGHAWGYEILWQRFLDSTRLSAAGPSGLGAGIADFFTTYAEDVYFNGTMGLAGSDIHLRETNVYKMLAWKDSQFWAPAWSIETDHIDATKNDAQNKPTTWASRYQLYGASSTAVFPPKREFTPLSLMYNQDVMMYRPYGGYNLTPFQNLTIKLPSQSQSVIGYNTYNPAAPVFDDHLDTVKGLELNSSAITVNGELVLGHGYPSLLYSKKVTSAPTGPGTLPGTYTYDNVTKTIRVTGPFIFNSVPNPVPGYPRLNETGSPSWIFAVSKVSYYDVEITTAGPNYNAGQWYTLRVTAKDGAGSAVTNWNGTVNLFTNNLGTTWGANGSSHTYVTPNAGVWWTTVNFGQVKSNTYINATDSMFPIDVFWAGPNQAVSGGSINVTTLIPEFPTLLIPVMGMAAVVAVLARRRKKST